MPPKPQKINVGIRLTPEVVAWLDAEAERRAMTRSGVAADLVHRVWLSERPK